MRVSHRCRKIETIAAKINPMDNLQRFIKSNLLRSAGDATQENMKEYMARKISNYVASLMKQPEDVDRGLTRPIVCYREDGSLDLRCGAMGCGSQTAGD